MYPCDNQALDKQYIFLIYNQIRERKTEIAVFFYLSLESMITSNWKSLECCLILAPMDPIWNIHEPFSPKKVFLKAFFSLALRQKLGLFQWNTPPTVHIKKVTLKTSFYNKLVFTGLTLSFYTLSYRNIKSFN